MINRGAIIVRKKQAYLDWALQLHGADITPSTDDECTVYLVPEYEDDNEAMAVLATCFDMIFESELWAWHTLESDWPQNRTLEMFLDWFKVEFHSLVEDLYDHPLLDDET